MSAPPPPPPPEEDEIDYDDNNVVVPRFDDGGEAPDAPPEPADDDDDEDEDEPAPPPPPIDTYESTSSTPLTSTKRNKVEQQPVSAQRNGDYASVSSALQAAASPIAKIQFDDAHSPEVCAIPN